MFALFYTSHPNRNIEDSRWRNIFICEAAVQNKLFSDIGTLRNPMKDVKNEMNTKRTYKWLEMKNRVDFSSVEIKYVYEWKS